MINNLDASISGQSGDHLNRGQFIESLLELFGSDTLDNLIKDASGYPSISSAYHHFCDLYGDNSARGIMHRLGQIYFQKFLNRIQLGEGLLAPTFRYLPPAKKIHSGIQIMLNAMDIFDVWETSITETEHLILIGLGNCEICKPDTTSKPVCNFITGLLQEYAKWIGGGKAYLVRETGCKASGNSACVFEISKHPVD